MSKDKQPRRPSKDLPADKLHPSSDMGKRAKGGDKISNPGLPKRMKGSEQTGVKATTEAGKKSR
jgi:hypothetical protein